MKPHGPMVKVLVKGRVLQRYGTNQILCPANLARYCYVRGVFVDP